MNTVKLILPWPPSVNSYWKKAGNGHLFVSARARKYRTDVVELINQFQLKLRINVEVETWITFHPPTKRKCDIDNFKKGLYDALTHGEFWIDDSLVQQEHTRFGPIIKGGRVEIIVTTLD